MASCIQPPPASLCFCGGCSPRYIGWLPLRRGFKTACVGVGVASGWPLANQQPPVAGHPRPTWSTSPNIHIDLVVLADRRANPSPTLSCSPIPVHPSLLSHPLSLSRPSEIARVSVPANHPPAASLTTPRRRSLADAEKVEPDQRARKFRK